MDWNIRRASGICCSLLLNFSVEGFSALYSMFGLTQYIDENVFDLRIGSYLSLSLTPNTMEIVMELVILLLVKTFYTKQNKIIKTEATKE